MYHKWAIIFFSAKFDYLLYKGNYSFTDWVERHEWKKAGKYNLWWG